MFTKLNRSILSSAELISGNVIAKLIGIVVLGYFARVLSKEQLAVFPVYGMLSQLSIPVFSFGIFPTFVRTLPSLLNHDKDMARSIMFSGAAIILGGTVFFSVITYIFSDFIAALVLGTQDFSSLIAIMSVGFIAIGLRRITDNILWSASRFSKISLLRVLESLTRPLLTVGLSLIFDLKGLVWGLVLNDLFCGFISLVFIKDILVGKFDGFYPWRKLLHQCLPFYLEGYLMYFRQQGDNWIISTCLGPAAMSVYYIAKAIYATLFMIFQSVDKVITVKLSSMRDKQEYMGEYVGRLVQIISHAMIPFIFFVIGLLPTLIYLIGGKKYTESLYPCIMLSFTVLVMFLRMPLGRSIFVLAKPVVRFRITLAETVILLPLLIALTPLLGVIGVALSRLITSIAGGIIVYCILRKIIRVRVPMVQIGLSLFASTLMCVFLIGCQRFYFSFYLIPFYTFGALLVFLMTTSLVKWNTFYETLDQVTPFTLKDPIKYLLRSIF